MNDPELADVFDKAGDLIRGGWVRFENAKDAQGLKVHPVSPDACRFCMAGAFIRAVHEAHPGINHDYDLVAVPLYRRGYEAITSKIKSNIGPWNDHPDRTKEEVEETFRELAHEARRTA